MCISVFVMYACVCMIRSIRYMPVPVPGLVPFGLGHLLLSVVDGSVQFYNYSRRMGRLGAGFVFAFSGWQGWIFIASYRRLDELLRGLVWARAHSNSLYVYRYLYHHGQTHLAFGGANSVWSTAPLCPTAWSMVSIRVYVHVHVNMKLTYWTQTGPMQTGREMKSIHRI